MELSYNTCQICIMSMKKNFSRSQSTAAHTAPSRPISSPHLPTRGLIPQVELHAGQLILVLGSELHQLFEGLLAGEAHVVQSGAQVGHVLTQGFHRTLQSRLLSGGGERRVTNQQARRREDDHC